MSEWIRSAISLGEPAARVQISREHQLEKFLPAYHTVGSSEKDGVAVESLVALLTKLIEQERPELTGCIPIAVRFDLSAAEWEVVVIHPSLPRVTMGWFIPLYRLGCAEPE